MLTEPIAIPDGLYLGYYIPGPNDHGDIDGLVLFKDVSELASLLQTEEEDLSWIDHGAGRMMLRSGMQIEDDAPPNSAATHLLRIGTKLADFDALPLIRGPIVNFRVNQAPPLATKRLPAD